MRIENGYPLNNPNRWTYIGTIGCFASNFLFVAEWLGQYTELTAKTLGLHIKSSYRFFGYKEIGGIPAIYYAIGFSVALIATLGFCYAFFFQLLHYQEKASTDKDSTAKKIINFIAFKNSKVQKVLNAIALFGSFVITTLWISGASLSIFLLPAKFSLLSKNIITYALILLGILACISYVRMYHQTLPGHIQAKNIDNQTLATDMSIILEELRRDTHSSAASHPNLLKTDDEWFNKHISRILNSMRGQEPEKTKIKTMSSFEKVKQRIIKNNVLEYTSMVIFSFICFFTNSYFMAFVLQFYIISNFHTTLFCDISLYAWAFGTIIGLFFTISAVYCYSRMYSEKPPININGIIFKADELVQFNHLANSCELGSIEKKTQKLSRSKKMLLNSALIGFIGVTVLDTLYPITISLRYIFHNEQKNFAFVGICLAAFVLSCLCTVGPYNTIKQSIEEYNNAQISYGFAFEKSSK